MCLCKQQKNSMAVSRSTAYGYAFTKACGVYIVGDEVACGNGPSYFADLSQASTILNTLRAGNATATNSATVKMNYCIPSLELSGSVLQTPSKQPQVSGFIKSTEDIAPNVTVRYKAGTYIELNPGFNSGSDFIAEIDPCVNNVTIIAQKKDDEEISVFEEKSSDEISHTNWLKVYPTILPSGNSITIEAGENINGVDLLMFNIEGKHVRSFRLNGFEPTTKMSVVLENLNTGVYILNAKDSTRNYSQKIVIQ